MISYFKEKKLGIVYEFDSLKKLIKCKYIETIFINNFLLSNKLFKKAIEENSEKGVEISSFLIIDFNGSKNSRFLGDSLEIYNNQIPIKYTNFNELTSFENTIKLIFIVPQENITNKDIFLINNYFKIHKENIIGWIYVDSKYKF